jgi:amino acid adenylation domain-containing protein
MDDLSKRIAALSPAKRAVLEERLAREHLSKRRTVIPPRPAAGPVPLSFAQERLWFFASLEPESSAYNLARTFRLRGIPNVSALERALGEIVARHEALRTVIADDGDEAVQVVVRGKISVLRVIDLSKGAGGEQGAVRLAQEEISRPFDLRTGPLLRACLLRLAPQDYIFTLTFHHIAFDGWSSAIFHRELSALYSAFCDGKTPDLQALPIQYGDYSLWQRQQLVGEQMESHLRYWRHHLADAPTLELPTDRPRAARPSYRGACHPIALPVDLCAKLRDFNLRENVTPFMSLLAAFEVLLARYSGQCDIVVGTPIANRRFVELENLIGFFVNSLAIRCDLSGEPSFRELVSRVRRTALDAYQHQDLPFEKLVENLNPEREMSRHPLFQVMFAVQNAPRQALALAGLEVSWQGMPVSSTRFDLELYLCTEGDDWSGWFVYSRDLFEQATIEGMVRQYVALLEGMLALPERPVSLVPMMSDREREQILVEWNATRVDYPRDRCIHELFEEQAKRTPQAIAVMFGEEELSYGELDERSGQLARYLRRLGVAAGARSAICIEPSVEMVVGLLGILKAGAAYVPIDPNYPQERISFMLADTQAAVLLTRKGLASQFSGSGIRIVCLDGDWETSQATGTGETRESSTAGDTAYVIFTSGSTGKPKGVCVPHRAVNRLVVNCDYVQLDADDVVAQVSNCCFDAATFEIWGALLNGSRLVGIEQERLLSPKSFSVELARHGVTTLFVTTALFNELVHERPDIFCKVRNVLFGGEECDPGAVRKALESGAPERLLHVYGPTETTTFATWYPIPANQSCAGRIPIGRPIANTEIYLLDSHLHPVPVGMAGEIWVGGEGVASGYLDRPELTAERFVPSPFVPGQRLYRTGDLGRFLPDGNIDFLGRLDNQVKIRGFRIELGEIESVMRQHPCVGAAAAVVRDNSNGGKQLVAYFVSSSSGSTDQAELREFVRKKLPDYMVPSAFVVLDRLPLTPNGKIDQKALPAPTLNQGRAGFVAPRTDTEKTVAEVWSTLLNVEGIGADDNFFQLGGHSLLATRVVSRLRSIFGFDIPLHILFENATVAAIAEFIDSARWATGGAFLSVVADREEFAI